MGGNTGPNGVGWMEGRRGDVLTVDVELITSPDFDLELALMEMRELRRRYFLADEEWEAELASRPTRAEHRKLQPRTAYVYRFFDADGRLLYVGKTVNMDGRRKGHAKRVWWPEVQRETVEQYGSEAEALAAEDRAIRDERPLYNRVTSRR